MSEVFVVYVAGILLFLMAGILGLFIREIYLACRRYQHHTIMKRRIEEAERNARLWQR